MSETAKPIREGTMVNKAKPKGQIVEFMEITKENIDEVVEWCHGWKAGLMQIEFYSQLRGYYGKASVGKILVQESVNPRHYREYSKEEFNHHFEEVTDNAVTDS